ncbi:hypothetical protein [Mucilaginibacter myungsuensis]|uniref:Uncharacterized protein n=1 Tax=Mucilaginibacter myungsuensis TaxID=649104 RepID=A0A929PWE4_9SPHI|nr:hypothetical protein [Mucilaginibacter myungsuensis]MBE9661986.1 hypothetical protein [Mucilaginibacter myungsuensis]MDN3599581.1 hypothetical protein [Mucilaginibacter myungsuensis]
MTPLFLKLENSRHLKIIPETRVFMDGHPILSYNYSIYKNGHQQAVDTNDYLGAVTFEDDGDIFTYTAGDGDTLHPDEVEEMIEQISSIRKDPTRWKLIANL